MKQANINNILEIKAIIDNNQVVAIPTDTIYGLATNLQSYDKIITLKKREQKPLVILCSSLEEMTKIIAINPKYLQVLEKYVPGALTIVGKTRNNNYAINKGYTTTGVRVPNHPSLIALLQATGPLVVSSANVSGGSETYSIDDVYQIFQDAISLYVTNDQELSMEASTVVNLDTLEVYRENSFSKELINDLKKTL